MALKLLDGSRRVDALAFDPDALFIVGIDKRPDGTIDGPEHPRYDPRVKLPIDEALVLSMMEHGRNIQTVTIVNVDDVGEVDDGRQRVRAGREGNRRLAEAGSDRRISIYTSAPLRGYDDAGHALLGMELNGLAQAEDQMTKCEKAAHALRFVDADGEAATKSKIARNNRWHPIQVDQALAIVEGAAADVKKALREGRITMALAFDLASKSKAEQKEAMATVAAAPEGKRVTKAKLKAKTGDKEAKATKRLLAKMLATLEVVAVDEETSEPSVVGYASDKMPLAFLVGALWALDGDIPDLVLNGNVALDDGGERKVTDVIKTAWELLRLVA